MAPKLTTEADVRIGGRVRFFREKARLSQGDLAQHLGVTWQQVAKYENATNRISASRLQEIANRLGVTVMDFYDAPAPMPLRKLTSAETRTALEAAALAHAEALEREAVPSWMSEAA